MLNGFWFFRIRILSGESFGRFYSQMVSFDMMLWWWGNLSSFWTKLSGGWSWAMITTFRRAWVAASKWLSCISFRASYHLSTTKGVRWVELRSRRVLVSSLLWVSTMVLRVLNPISIKSTHQIVVLIKIDWSWWWWSPIIPSTDLYIVISLAFTIRSDVFSFISLFMFGYFRSWYFYLSSNSLSLWSLTVSCCFLSPCHISLPRSFKYSLFVSNNAVSKSFFIHLPSPSFLASLLVSPLPLFLQHLSSVFHVVSSHAPCSFCFDFSSGSFFLTSFKVNAWPDPILNHWLLMLEMSLSSILNSSIDSLLNLRQQLILLLLKMHQGVFQGSDLVVHLRFMRGRVLRSFCLLSSTSFSSRVLDLRHDLTVVRTFIWSHGQMVMTLELACAVYRIGSCHWQVV